LTHAHDNSPVTADDLAFQEACLQRVSRTFALTIPQLPGKIRDIVGNAYLLCRIADTVEDCDTLSLEDKRRLCAQFVRVVSGEEPPWAFAAEAGERIQGAQWADDRDLVRQTPRVMRIFGTFPEDAQAAVRRCVRIMAEGMESFQEGQFVDGLRDQRHLDAYCYHVAGVVGEMLTDIFCAYSPAMANQKPALQKLAVSFGQGLQMTNILKDVWDDLARQVCWLPREPFAAHGFDLRTLENATAANAAFRAGLIEQVAIAHGHLRNALQYTLLIPKSEPGIRRFCLWAIGMAVLTLRKIDRNREFRSGAEVKIPRRSVRATIWTTRIAGANNFLTKGLFNLAATGLPKLPQTPTVASAHRIPSAK